MHFKTCSWLCNFVLEWDPIILNVHTLHVRGWAPIPKTHDDTQHEQQYISKHTPRGTARHTNTAVRHISTQTHHQQVDRCVSNGRIMHHAQHGWHTCISKSLVFLRNMHNLLEKNTPYEPEFFEKNTPYEIYFWAYFCCLSIILGFRWDEMINHLIEIHNSGRLVDWRCIRFNFNLTIRWWIGLHFRLFLTNWCAICVFYGQI